MCLPSMILPFCDFNILIIIMSEICCPISDYNKLSANGGGTGIILQPGAYMQGGHFDQDDCTDADGATDAEAGVFLTGGRSAAAARNAAYQTLSNVTTSSTASHQQPVPAMAMSNDKTDSEADPFDEDGEKPPSAFELVSGAGVAKPATGWRKELGKKGIVSSSFV